MMNNILTIYRSKKASITTGIVDRSECLKTEAIDRLSPLTSAFSNFISFPSDSSAELEKYSEMDVDPKPIPIADSCNSAAASTTSSSPHQLSVDIQSSQHSHQQQLEPNQESFLFVQPNDYANVPMTTNNNAIGGGNSNTRRHTVGPGDVTYEQSLASASPAPINFKFGPPEQPHNLPINLPMLQNQPLHNFTIKNQHLLKPPTVMGASKYEFVVFLFLFF